MKKQLVLLLTFALLGAGSVRAETPKDVTTRRLRHHCPMDDIDLVQRFLWDGADPCWVDAGEAAIHIAAKLGKTDILRAMLEVLRIKDLKKVDTPDQYGMSALCHAACTENYSLVEQLQMAGANLNHAAINGMTPLCFAAAHGCTRRIPQLSESTANIDHRTPDGYTPLHFAVFNGKSAAVRVLRQCGAKEIEDRHGRTPSSYLRRASIEFPIVNGNRDAVFEARGALLQALATKVVS